MRIEHIQIDHFKLPLPSVLSDATHGSITHSALVTVRIRDDDGGEGLGYTYTVNDIGASALRVLLERDIAPVLLGEDPRDIERLWKRMWWHLHFVGRGGLAAFAMAAADIALWDLGAVRAGQPLWRHLGGHRRRVPAYAGGIDLDFPIDELLAQTARFLDEGFRAIKTKVGRPRLSEDVERVRAVRDLLGPDVPLMVDANMRWSVSEAVTAARALQPFHLTWLEEPTVPDDYAGHARIAAEGGLPLATGENLHSLYEFEHMIRYGSISFPEPDVATVGGVTPWLKVARLAEASNLPVTSHGVHDLHVHLLAAVPNPSYLEVHGFSLEPYLRHRLVLEGGEALAPERPGHGVELDWESLAAHRQP